MLTWLEAELGCVGHNWLQTPRRCADGLEDEGPRFKRRSRVQAYYLPGHSWGASGFQAPLSSVNESVDAWLVLHVGPAMTRPGCAQRQLGLTPASPRPPRRDKKGRKWLDGWIISESTHTARQQTGLRLRLTYTSEEAVSARTVACHHWIRFIRSHVVWWLNTDNGVGGFGSVLRSVMTTSQD